MLVRELIEKLNEIEDKELPIVLETDHGQTPMHLNGVGSDVVDDLDQFMLEYVWAEDEDEEPEGHKVIVLSAY